MLVQAGARRKVAVIVNENAHGVGRRVIDDLTGLLPTRDLFVSSSLDHSRQIAAAVVEHKYDTVLCGGGDGTFVQCLSDVAAEARRRAVELPKFGVLRLGTGNALADALGASPATLAGLSHDLGRAHQAKEVRPLSLLEVDGRLTPFAGCGLDAEILADLRKMNALIDRLAGPVAGAIGAKARYALSVGLRSTPRFLVSRLPEVEIINRGQPAYRVDWKSGALLDEEPLAPGAVLWRGRPSIATCSTIPNFGLGMRMFPFAELRRGYFQLRCATASTYEMLRHLPAVFRGDYRSPSLIDFLCTSIEIRVERPVPVQIGGDLQDGQRARLKVSLANAPIRVLA